MKYRVVVRAIGCEIDVEFDGEPIFKIYDCTFDSGSIALRTYHSLAEFRNLRIHEAFAPTPAPSIRITRQAAGGDALFCETFRRLKNLDRKMAFFSDVFFGVWFGGVPPGGVWR